MGSGTNASGDASIAMGANTIANGNYATAMGESTIASEYASTAMGNHTTANGETSTVMGNFTSAQAYNETTIGSYNTEAASYDASVWVSTDRLFTIGNGTGATTLSDALVMLKNGNTTLKGALTLTNGTSSYTLPQTDGTAGQVLTTDGSGVVSWGSAAGGGGSLNTAYNYGSAGAGRTITADNGAVLINGTDGLQVTGTYGSGNSLALSGGGTRMFFYPQKAAFRAGDVTGTQWDNDSIGNFSVAMGYNTKAKAFYSTAMGVGTTASGNVSTAMGANTTAKAFYSTAMGHGTIASGQASTAMGGQTSAEAYTETVIGSYNTQAISPDPYLWVPTDRLFTIGNGTAGNVKSDALVMLKNGNVGMGTTAPTEPTMGLHLKNDNGLLVEGTYGSGNTLDVAGAGTRMFFYPKKAAFRAGRVLGTAWDNDSIGHYSVAFGVNTKAKGMYSIAMGNGAKASGPSSVAIGFDSNASASGAMATGGITLAKGIYSTAMGYATIASGYNATAIGRGTEAEAYSETTIGAYNTNAASPNANIWVPTDRLFTIGNGLGYFNKSDALVMLKDGSTTFSGNVTGPSFSTPSDKRFKNNLNSLTSVSGSALKNLANIGSYYYNYKVEEFPERQFPKNRQIGFIAQEVEAIYPELVITDEQGYKKVDYAKITPVLVEAIKELKAENEALKAKNDKFEAKIEALENAVYGNTKR